MKIYRNTGRQLLIFLTSALAFCLPFTSTCTGIEYEYKELLPSGWLWVSVHDINNLGAVAGYGHDGQDGKGFIYREGLYTELSPPEGDSPYPYAINDNEAIVGYWNYLINEPKGFLFSEGIYKKITPPGCKLVTAYDINENEEVVGEGGEFEGEFRKTKGFIYREGEYTFILPPNWMWAQANAINDNGDAVGYGQLITVPDQAYFLLEDLSTAMVN